MTMSSSLTSDWRQSETESDARIILVGGVRRGNLFPHPPSPDGVELDPHSGRWIKQKTGLGVIAPETSLIGEGVFFENKYRKSD